jgi:hypothetical protein
MALDWELKIYSTTGLGGSSVIMNERSQSNFRRVWGDSAKEADERNKLILYSTEVCVGGLSNVDDVDGLKFAPSETFSLVRVRVRCSGMAVSTIVGGRWIKQSMTTVREHRFRQGE